MTFADRLKSRMRELDLTQSKLSGLTGIAKSSISQYLSGKNTPSAFKVKMLANALNVSPDWLSGMTEESVISEHSNNLSVERAATLMGVGKQFIRVGLQNGVLPFGYAVKISGNRFTYHISPKKFAEYTGIEVPVNSKGGVA